jgi:hypothetical protein
MENNEKSPIERIQEEKSNKEDRSPDSQVEDLKEHSTP